MLKINWKYLAFSSSLTLYSKITKLKLKTYKMTKTLKLEILTCIYKRIQLLKLENGKYKNSNKKNSN